MKEDPKIDRYLKIMAWAEKRYVVVGKLVISIGGIAGPFSRIEAAAWKKYMS